MNDPAAELAALDFQPPTTAPKRNLFLILPSGDVSFTESGNQIFKIIGDARGLFYRGDCVHEVVVNPDGSKRLEPLNDRKFRTRLDDYGTVTAWRVGRNGEAVLQPTRCSEETARALLVSLPARNLLPNVTALSGCPVLAKTTDGPRILGPGWHPLNGGLFITGGSTPPSVPLNEAVPTLCGLLAEFDFASPGDRSRALASLIAPALRFGGWLLNPLPVDIGEADASQSGKTYRQKLVAAIYRESCNVVVQRNAGVGGTDESLSQKLIDGRPFILFDNLRGKLDSQFLEAILTAPAEMPARVPHRGEVRVDTRAFVFQLTSNGVETTRDLANRATICRIRKRPARFKFRTYPEGDLHAYIVANQPLFLGSVFAIISEWVSRGKQRTDETRHDFREWSQTLDWIVQRIFAAAPLLDGHDDARERVSDPRRVWLRALCIALRDAGRTGATEWFATQLGEFAIENDVLPPNAAKDASEEEVGRKVGIIMGAAFGQSDELEVDGFQIRRIHRSNPDTRNPAKVYRFE